MSLWSTPAGGPSPFDGLPELEPEEWAFVLMTVILSDRTAEEEAQLAPFRTPPPSMFDLMRMEMD